MTLAKHSQWAELDSMERRMRRFFEEIGVVPAVMPAADVYETDGDFVVELEVPGYAQKDLDVALIDHMLVVKGAVEAEKDEQDKTFRLHERLARSFERRFVVPPEADATKFEAAFEKGVLKVSAPKTPEAAPRTIEIGTKA